MAKRQITLEEVTNFLLTLPYSDFKNVVNQYSNHTQSNFDQEMNILVKLNFQQRLERLGINSVCPKCQSSVIVKNGKRANGIQEFKCRSCNSKFTLFINTIGGADIWLKVLEMTLNNYSIEKMLNVLVNDYDCIGLNHKTVWLNYYKMTDIIR